MTEPSVAILLFQVAQERNYIHDDLMPAVSAELTRLGVRNEIYETTVPAMDAPDANDLSSVDALVERLRGRHPVCVYSRLWSQRVFEHLRAALPDVTWVHMGDPRKAFEGTDHRLVVERVPTLAAIARAAAAGHKPTSEELDLPVIPVNASHGRANLARIRVGDEKRPDRPAVVHGSPGCAYSQDVRQNPLFAGVPFPDDGKVVLNGCSFCATGGVARKPAGEVLRSVLEQLDNILINEPDTARVQINDQNPLPYLVQFVEHAGARAQRPLEILMETRADWLLGGVGVIERALAAAERHGHKILLFLLGVENFSQKELDLLNKGVTAEMNERAVHECRRLKRAYPKSYSDTRAAFGFILYNPWTEPRDLLLNAMAVERTGMREFRGQIARSKLRLYPDTALYYKARHEGLLAERFAYEAMDSARRYGYEAEVPWRFRSEATDAAYGIHDAIFRLHGKHEEMKMLVEIVRFLERRPDAVSTPREDAARELVAQMGSRFAREIRHSG